MGIFDFFNKKRNDNQKANNSRSSGKSFNTTGTNWHNGNQNEANYSDRHYNTSNRQRDSRKAYSASKVEKGTVCEGTIIKIQSYGLIVDIGIDKGIVFLSDISCQYTTEKDLKDFFYYGQKVNVVILKYDEYGRLSLGMKQLQSLSYKEGEKVRVIVKRITDKVECVICDGNNIRCSIPEKELSWAGDLNASDLLNKEIEAKIISINDRDGKYKIKCSLRQMTKDPWEDVVDIIEGSVIEVKVVKHDKNGISIVTNNDGLPGFIHKNQVTWLKNDSDITESDYPTVSKTIRVVVKTFQREKKILLCSIRDLKSNPWEQLKVGMTVKGKAIIGSPRRYIVKLTNGVEGQCCDDMLIRCGIEYDFLLISIDPNSRTVVVSKEAESIMKKDVHDVKTFFKKRSPKTQFFMLEDKILLPQDVMCDGKTVSIPYAMAWISYFRSHPSKFDKHTVISTVKTKSGTMNSFISIDINDYGYVPYITNERLLMNTDFNIKIEIPTENGYLVQAAGRIGYVSKDTIPSRFESSKDELSVRFASVSNHKQIDSLAVNRQDTSVDDEKKNLFKLDDDEINVLDDADRTILEILESECPYLNKNNCNRINGKIYVCYDSNSLLALDNFLEKNASYFSTNNFWLTSYTIEQTGVQILLIYNDEDIMLECQATDGRIFVRNFYSDRKQSEMQDKLNRNTKALILPASNLGIFKMYNTPSTFDAAKVRLLLSRQYDVYTRILPDLQKKILDKKRDIGKDYTIMSKYLEYQQGLEKQKLDGIEVSVNSSHITISSQEGSFSPKLILSEPQCSSLLQGENEDQLVKIIKNGTEKEEYAILSDGDDDGEYVLSFKSASDLGAYCNDGFVLTPNANTFHLRVQQRSVDDFIYKSELLTKLDSGKLREPFFDKNIAFFDQKFNDVEEGNNQPIAIKKAIGNQDIFLIQGPPGTGKTSVIVEIIRQLVAKGEKILVCSQAHSAVKNIYDRLIATDSTLRVGNLDVEATMKPISYKNYMSFLTHNLQLLTVLSQGDRERADQLCDSYAHTYSEDVEKDFTEAHEYLVNYYDSEERDMDELKRLIEDYKEEIEQLSSDNNSFYTASHISSLQVVMGTCIGVGTNRDIYKSGMKFDTLIIDEAGKANLAETNVPMQLASKYILVGDENQLPPYMDSEEIKNFKESDDVKGLDGDNVEKALGKSLFEYFLKHPNFPPESKVLLNYQYRMNPAIGEKISSLFYYGKLRNGKGTEKQACDISGLNEAVIFFDTGNTNDIRRYNPYEENAGNGSIWNPCEIEILIKEILPKLEEMLQLDNDLTVGIIAPYKEQVQQIKKALGRIHSVLKDSVYTVDNVQGQEYDVVVLSFVRAFSENRKVGFLDDLRRLNVALSRAKKKLIMIGHLDTLTRPCAHRLYNIEENFQPVEIFKRISADATIQKAELNSIDKLRKYGIEEGHIFRECRIVVDGKKCGFLMKLGDEELRFTLPAIMGLKNGDTYDVQFSAYSSSWDNRPVFKIIPLSVKAEVVEHNQKTGRIRLENGEVLNICFNQRKKTLLSQILGMNNLCGFNLPFNIIGNTISLNEDKLRKKVTMWHYAKGTKMTTRVIMTNSKCIYVLCKNVIGIIFKRDNAQKFDDIHIGDIINCEVYAKWEEAGMVKFNYINKDV